MSVGYLGHSWKVRTFESFKVRFLSKERTVLICEDILVKNSQKQHDRDVETGIKMCF